ncbi:MAG: hypothetical protein HYV95_13645 [Opitutae bacterium]|nr:hypothetical protein [Opitutae bacterium]
MPAGETAAHARLKQLALDWAAASGFPIAAPEVRLPRSGFRVDVAAYRPARREGAVATMVFECKQARADLLKDSRAELPTRQKLAELLARRAKLEQMLGEHRPDLRRGETLFPEFDAFDFSALRHETYAAVLAEITRLQARSIHGVKFDRMFRYQAADLLYLVAEDGIFAAEEIPAGWGLLVRRDEVLVLTRQPLRLSPAPELRHQLLENIALAATRARRNRA